ncbi:MAG TPA: diguanylate cyclase [Solirubrobacteraceae bacterium]|nr:diguanylate cyclase [Solirubrobacteraceae bacterium]
MFGRSFRSRLTAFFIVIVILPMLAVSVILFRLVSDSERGKSDARIAQAQTAAEGLFRDEERRAADAGRRIGRSPALAEAIAGGDREEIEGELAMLAERHRVVRADLELDDGGRVQVGQGVPVAAATTALVDPEGRNEGTLHTAAVDAAGYATRVREITGLETIVLDPGGGSIASTLDNVDGRRLPDRGEVEIDGRRYRLTAFSAPAFRGGGRIKVRLLSDERHIQTAITNDSLVVAAMLLAFLVLAFAFALTVSRSLQAQIQRLLEAAKRLGGGELSVKVPTEGNDEFAALGDEFNAMARQLESRLAELESERTRLQQSIRRVGESFATGLDRDGVLRIVVQTAMDGVGADVGRATVRDAPGGPLAESARVGDVAAFEAVLRAAETAVVDGREAAEASVAGMHALSHPLKPSEGRGKILGLITVARSERAFSDAERDLFNYLANQAAVSVENVDLHEAVQRQAVTDELTGLFNHRRFQEVISAEVERAKRFQHSLGLIMLDIDDFKLVNDHHGHLQGDEVLREVARVLLEASREIDEPARYGGEEMAVALPQTDLEGAMRFAERVRQRIEELEIPLVRGEGSIRITASFGAAALPESAATDKDALVAAADSALYRAKRLGKNRVVKAG